LVSRLGADRNRFGVDAYQCTLPAFAASQDSASAASLAAMTSRNGFAAQPSWTAWTSRQRVD